MQSLITFVFQCPSLVHNLISLFYVYIVRCFMAVPCTAIALLNILKENYKLEEKTVPVCLQYGKK